MFRLDGERAIVTGSEGRLGKVWIKALREAGATVCGSDHPTLLGGFFGRASAAPEFCGSADITEVRDVVPAVRLMTATLGGTPTILVNNAGVDDRPIMTQGEAWPQFDVARKMAL